MRMETEGVLSVIVPAYNARESLGKCLDSILAQTYHNLEILVIDDGSTDGTAEICDAYGRKDQRIKAIHISNGGPARARNAGLKEMSGRYLTFVDADDYIEPGLYEAILSELQKEQAVMLISGWFHHDVVKGTVTQKEAGSPGSLRPQQVKQRVLRYTESCGGGYPWNKLIDLSGIRKMVYFNESLSIYEDMVWLIEMLDNIPLSDKVRISACKGYHYIDRPDSLSHLWTIPRYISMIRAWDIVCGMTEIRGKAKLRHDREIVDAIWGICKNKGKASNLYKEHRNLFHVLRYRSDIRRCIKVVLVKGYCKLPLGNAKKR